MACNSLQSHAYALHALVITPVLPGSNIQRIQRMVQHLKCLGLPGGETHRLDQYVSKMAVSFERLTNYKEYRTPQALLCMRLLAPP